MYEIIRIKILACWFDLIYFEMCFYVYYYMTYLCFTDSPCYDVSYYNYNSGWPYYIVIHFPFIAHHYYTFF